MRFTTPEPTSHRVMAVPAIALTTASANTQFIAELYSAGDEFAASHLTLSRPHPIGNTQVIRFGSPDVCPNSGSCKRINAKRFDGIDVSVLPENDLRKTQVSLRRTKKELSRRKQPTVFLQSWRSAGCSVLAPTFPTGETLSLKHLRMAPRCVDCR